MNFFLLVTYLYNYSYKVIGFLINLNYLGVVYQSFYYYVYFCLVNFGLFSCIGTIVYLVLCTFVVCSGYLVVFVYIWQRCAVSVSSAIITPFFERWFTFEIWVFFLACAIKSILCVKYSVMNHAKSFCKSCLTFCEISLFENFSRIVFKNAQNAAISFRFV